MELPVLLCLAGPAQAAHYLLTYTGPALGKDPGGLPAVQGAKRLKFTVQVANIYPGRRAVYGLNADLHVTAFSDGTHTLSSFAAGGYTLAINYLDGTFNATGATLMANEAYVVFYSHDCQTGGPACFHYEAASSFDGSTGFDAVLRTQVPCPNFTQCAHRNQSLTVGSWTVKKIP